MISARKLFQWKVYIMEGLGLGITLDDGTHWAHKRWRVPHFLSSEYRSAIANKYKSRRLATPIYSLNYGT